MNATTHSYESRRLALYILCAGALMIVLDATIVNVALPSIQDDLGFSQSSLAWVVNAYLIGFGGFLLLAGRLGDLIGQRRIFLIGIAIFTVASVLCGVSVNQGMLIGARFVQGVGGALSSAVVLAMIVTMFPEPREQAKAIGVYGFVASAGSSIGLLLGGILTDAISWHWIFFINVPVGIATAILARRHVEDKAGHRLRRGRGLLRRRGAHRRRDGRRLRNPRRHRARLGRRADAWPDRRVGRCWSAAFVVRQARIENPLMPLRLFKSRNIVGANVVMALLVAGMFAMFFLGALYLQRVLHYNPLEVGFAFLPSALVMGALSLEYSEKLIMRFGAKQTLIPAMFLLALGLLWFSRAPVDGNYWIDVLPATVLIGFGAGTGFPALMGLSMSGAEPQDMGLASGLINATVQVGGAIGLSVLATLAASRTESLDRPTASRRSPRSTAASTSPSCSARA